MPVDFQIVLNLRADPAMIVQRPRGPTVRGLRARREDIPKEAVEIIEAMLLREAVYQGGSENTADRIMESGLAARNQLLNLGFTSDQFHVWVRVIATAPRSAPPATEDE